MILLLGPLGLFWKVLLSHLLVFLVFFGLAVFGSLDYSLDFSWVSFWVLVGFSGFVLVPLRPLRLVK